MNRLTSPLQLSHHPILTLIKDNQHILSVDEYDHDVQVDIYHKMLAKGDKSPAYLEKMKERLVKEELRLDYSNALLSKLQRHDFMAVYSALEQAIQEAKIRGNCKNLSPNTYGFTIHFSQSETDCLIL